MEPLAASTTEAAAAEAPVTGERLPMMEIGLERVARALQATLRKYADDKVSVATKAMRDMRFSTYLRENKPPYTFYIARFEVTGAPVLLVSQGDLVQLTVDLLLKSRQPVVEIAGRPFTATERILTERMIRMIMNEIGASFQPIAEFNLKMDRTETNPRFLTAVREKDGLLATTITITIGDRKGSIDLLIPHASLEPYKDVLRQQYAGDKFGRDQLWEQHLTQELLVSHLRVTAILDEPMVPLSDVINWQVGSVLPLDITANEPIRLHTGQSAVFFGSMGRHDDRVVVRIDGRLE
ncbi:MAG TPA: FliM/FliN family flagellar motor switch protein [Verrucomicrobiae bacterium]|nr:FliM/FliN family flagellar motor switch protein [Verrucomicrobiae bacterium]